jgi:hypothetical protein
MFNFFSCFAGCFVNAKGDKSATAVSHVRWNLAFQKFCQRRGFGQLQKFDRPTWPWF